MTRSSPTSRRLKNLAMRSSLGDQVCGCTNSPILFHFGSDHLTVNSGDDSKGYFIQPTVILTQNAKSITLVEEIFGPVVTVR